jgi:hypothetical protein
MYMDGVFLFVCGCREGCNTLERVTKRKKGEHGISLNINVLYTYLEPT